jgi:DNA-binding beta-propeller fold protein YncE
MNVGQARLRLVQAGAAVAAAALVAGCGSNYRPVVTPINPSGPPAQPSSFAVVVSAPSPSAPGIATIIDYSGDTIMATAPIGPGPTSFTVDATGSTGYTINTDGTLTNFPVSSTLQAKNITYTTLASNAEPLNLFSPTAGLWAADLQGDQADVFTGSPQTFLRSIPLAPTPVTIVGVGSIGQRIFAISQGNSLGAGSNISSPVACNNSPSTVGVNGEVDSIETSSYTISARIPVGVCPVFGVESVDSRRFFVLNRGSDTVSVINAQDNTLDDQCPPPTGCLNQNGQPYFTHPSLPLSTAAGLTGTNVPALAGPVYADYNAATSQLVVADYDGGTISVIDVSLDEYGNDSPTFGTTFTIPVGNNPASVTALYYGNPARAYTANQADGTVTIVNLSSHTVEKTLSVVGHPRTVVSTQNSLYGKVYVASPDSPFVTIIRTDEDIVDTTILVQGNVVDVRVSSQNAGSGNNNNVSRVPGYGQPCNMPGAGPAASLMDCQQLPLPQ